MVSDTVIWRTVTLLYYSVLTTQITASI